MSAMQTIIEIAKDRRVLMLLAITLAAIALVFLNGGLKFGIDFSGGIRVPIVLEKPTDPVTMEMMVNTIKTRTSTFGLTEVKVRPVGDSEIYVEVPKSNTALVKQLESLLSHQGIYQGIVDGKVAIDGNDIYSDSIYKLSQAQLRGSAQWGVSFSVSQRGQERFARTVKGKANYPLYMYLDRPEDSIVVVSENDLLYTVSNATKQAGVLGSDVAIRAATEALAMNGSDIRIYLDDSILSGEILPKPATNRTRAIVSSGASPELKRRLNASGFVVFERTPDEMRPRYSPQQQGGYLVNEWAAVGLKSAPTLSPSVTEGVPSFSYSITGGAEGIGAGLTKDADTKARETESILKGGALPVQISIGSVVDIPAPLGEEFKRLSVIGALFALLSISIMVAIRYRTAKVVLPIILISLNELVILVAIIGSFSIDLAAMAGIIAAIGVSVDAQIVVTDELLKHKVAGGLEQRLEGAFDIIVTNVIVAVVAMLPLLLFSGLVEIIGFATSTILGSLLGLFISRPAYGAIVEKLFEGDLAKIS